MSKIVYFMKAKTGLVKIGVSANVQVRQNTIARELGSAVQVIREVQGDNRLEKAYHRRFAERRVRGEWFEFDPEMLTVEVIVEGSRKKRITFDFQDRALQRLDALKSETEAATYAEVVKNALRLYEAIIAEEKAGTLFFTRDVNGNYIAFKPFL